MGKLVPPNSSGREIYILLFPFLPKNNRRLPPVWGTQRTSRPWRYCYPITPNLLLSCQCPYFFGGKKTIQKNWEMHLQLWSVAVITAQLLGTGELDSSCGLFHKRLPSRIKFTLKTSHPSTLSTCTWCFTCSPSDTSDKSVSNFPVSGLLVSIVVFGVSTVG